MRAYLCAWLCLCRSRRAVRASVRALRRAQPLQASNPRSDGWLVRWKDEWHRRKDRRRLFCGSIGTYRQVITAPPRTSGSALDTISYCGWGNDSEKGSSLAFVFHLRLCLSLSLAPLGLCFFARMLTLTVDRRRFILFHPRSWKGFANRKCFYPQRSTICYVQWR